MAGLLDFIQGASKGFWAGNLGAPVDMATLALNGLIAGGGYAGHKLGLLSTPPELIEKPVGGSEWIADKMRGAGLLSDAPGSTADNYGQVAGGLLGPVVAAKSPQIASGLLRAADNVAIPSTLNKQAGVVMFGKGSNIEDARSFAKKVQSLDKSLSPVIEEANGGSVYVTVQKLPLTKAGELAKRGRPTDLGFKARFADHPSYWGNTISSDPFTQNTVDDVIAAMQPYVSRNPMDSPKTRRIARFDPSLRLGSIEEQALNENVLKNGGGVRYDTINKTPFSMLP